MDGNLKVAHDDDECECRYTSIVTSSAQPVEVVTIDAMAQEVCWLFPILTNFTSGQTSA